MSYTTVLAVTPDRRPTCLLELRNAHGWSPSIWQRLVAHNYGYTGYSLFDDHTLNRLWSSIETLPAWQQAPLVLTFDTGVVPYQAFEWTAEQLMEFSTRLPAPGWHVDHVPAVVELLRTGPEAPLLGVHGTSVSDDPFDPWDYEMDDYGSGIPLADMYVLECHRAYLPEVPRADEKS